MDIEGAKKIFEEYVHEKKLRITPERYEVLNAAMNFDGHFDADELFSVMRSKKSKISRATVYNTLDVLIACGLLSKYRFDEKHSRYERAFGRPRHDHLICIGCGDIIEFVAPKLEKIQKDICETHSFQPQNSTLQIFGYCEKCQKPK
ncbi:MAG: transcriptional repressor [Ignavibacteriales bacterium]|nr:transcriptional repressor [Ignavibacteriales bacterium]